MKSVQVFEGDGEAIPRRKRTSIHVWRNCLKLSSSSRDKEPGKIKVCWQTSNSRWFNDIDFWNGGDFLEWKMVNYIDDLTLHLEQAKLLSGIFPEANRNFTAEFSYKNGWYLDRGKLSYLPTLDVSW